MSSTPISVFVADDHALVRQALEQGIAGNPDLVLVGSAVDGLQAISGIKRTSPDVAIIDIAMPHANGLEVLVEARRWSPETAVVMLTGMLTRGILAEVIGRKVGGVFLKSEDPAALINALPKVAAGEQVLSAGVRAIVGDGSGPLQELTDRESQVLQGIVRGLRSAQIAEQLCISRNTVENHRANIMRKLGVGTMAELLSLALKEGLFEYDRHL